MCILDYMDSCIQTNIDGCTRETMHVLHISLSKSYLIYLGGPHEIYFSTALLTMTFQHLPNPSGLSRSFIKICLSPFLAP